MAVVFADSAKQLLADALTNPKYYCSQSSKSPGVRETHPEFVEDWSDFDEWVSKEMAAFKDITDLPFERPQHSFSGGHGAAYLCQTFSESCLHPVGVVIQADYERQGKRDVPRYCLTGRAL